MWMKRQISDDQHDLVVVPLPMRLALVAAVVVVLATGLFPSPALEFARTSVEGLGAMSGSMLGLGQ
jgi:hypothetical protein